MRAQPFYEEIEKPSSPYTSHFLSADTIVPGYTNPQSLNRYSYVTNNPLKYTDPTGHMQASDDYKDSDGKCDKGDKACNQMKAKIKRKKDQSRGQTLSGTNPYIGTPQNLGAYVSGIWVGGGVPNHFGVMGYVPEQEGDHVYWAGVNAGLRYNATYSIGFYENGAQLNITERYSLSKNTEYTEIETAGSILNIKTSNGTASNVSLGEFDITKSKVRNTTITIYGSYPDEMQISIFIKLSSQSQILSAPMSNFQFNNNPVSVWP